MLKKQLIFYILITFCVKIISFAQHPNNHSLPALTIISDVEPQPLLAQAIRLNEALSFLGSSLSQQDAKRLKQLQDKPLTTETCKFIQAILDPYCLAMVNINPEARVKVAKGPATAKLIQGGWTSFLIKVHNEAGVTAQLQVESINAQPALHMATNPDQPHAMERNLLTPGQVANRFLKYRYTITVLCRQSSQDLIWSMQWCRYIVKTPVNVKLK